jgi:serine/threonine protein kinase
MPSIPGFEILGELGRGGMGVVYKARQLRRDRLVALKMIQSGCGAGFVELARFCVEAQAVACLTHPNIVQIHEVGVHGGYPFFALEYAPGGNLAQKIQNQVQPPYWSAEVVKTLALALHHAHGRGILHRDLKPANVVLMADGTPKVTDFGLAKFSRPMREVGEQYSTLRPTPEEVETFFVFAQMHRPGDAQPSWDASQESWEQLIIEILCEQHLKRFGSDVVSRGLSATKDFMADAAKQWQPGLPGSSRCLDNLTQSGTIMGSLHYMAPEQANGELHRIGPPTDVYALGAVLYRMLTGRPLFDGTSKAQVLDQIRHEPPTPVDPNVPHDLVAICLKCLEKPIGRRYSGADGVAGDLCRFLDSHTGPAPSDGHQSPGLGRKGEMTTTS